MLLTLFLTLASLLTFEIQPISAKTTIQEDNFAEFKNLKYHGLDGLFSSLKVSGTVTLYDDYDLSPSANNKTFINESVPDLGDFPKEISSGTWSKTIKSLKVNGTVTLWEYPYFEGRTTTFTSDTLPYEDIGTEWNLNPNLTKDEAWDRRLWYWSLGLLEISKEDSSKYVNWSQDGLVELEAKDESPWDPWTASNFDQGYERYENEVYSLVEWGWNDFANSLRVEGNITLYEHVGYNGTSISFSEDVEDLAVHGWNGRASSLKLTIGSRVTLYQSTNFRGGSITFAHPTYQPPDLKVGDKGSITLEGVVHDWNSTDLPWSSTSWTGVKFDVFAVENRSSHTDKVLMLEMYFIRTGANLDWWVFYPAGWISTWDGSDRHCFRQDGNSYNYLVAIDAFPEFVERTVYPGDTTKWKINVKAFIQGACNHFSDLDINKLSIVKMSFTLESAYNGADAAVSCSLDRLRLAYTNATNSAASFHYYERTPRTMTFDASGSYGDYASYGWDFGDGSTVTTTQPIINHTYLSTGNYKVTLNATTDYGLWNTTSRQVQVTLKTDLNRDGKVNIQEISFVAAALGSKPSHPRWNPVADVDRNAEVNMIDIVIIAIDYGKAA